MTLNSIAELQSRLKIWAFKLDFAEKERELANQLSDLRMGIQQIRDSKTLTKVLACLLAIGNHLNDRYDFVFGFFPLFRIGYSLKFSRQSLFQTKILPAQA